MPVKRILYRGEIRKMFRDLPPETKAKTNWQQFLNYQRKLHKHMKGEQIRAPESFAEIKDGAVGL